MPTSSPETITLADGKIRCAFQIQDPVFRAYHDREFGRPVADDRRVFEKICIETFGAGLSFLQMLNRREAFRAAFDNFEFAAIAEYDADMVDHIMQAPGMLRNRRKIAAVLHNARRALELREEYGSLAAFLWSFEPAPGDRPAVITEKYLRANPTPPSAQAMAKALRQRDWKWVGPYGLYAVQQSLGVVNDHFAGCFCREECAELRQGFVRPG